MPWRVIAHGDQVWHVDALAERPANAEAWQLVLSFRSASERAGRSFWTLYPLEATSKSSLFIQAERIPDTALFHLELPEVRPHGHLPHALAPQTRDGARNAAQLL